MDGIFILATNRWGCNTSNRKQFKSFQIPANVVKMCGISDGRKRLIRISTSHSDTFELLCTVSSGHELQIPAKFLNNIVKSNFIIFEIIDWLQKPSLNFNNNIPDMDLDYYEGGSVLRTHLAIERNRNIIVAAKERRLAEKGKLECEVCDLSFKDRYRYIGDGFIEAHHLLPISKKTIRTKTNIDDIALLCSNCHRMIHRGNPILTINELKSFLIIK